jgi:hypothetical protein
MRTTSLSEIKSELQNLPAKEIAELCLRLARYKKENKELLAYLLFESHDPEAYTAGVKENMDEGFKDLNTRNLYLAKKTLRKILRQANRHIKYASNKQIEAELLIYFCARLAASAIALHKNKTLANMFQRQIEKIKAALATLHEDIQYDLLKQLEQLQTDI